MGCTVPPDEAPEIGRLRFERRARSQHDRPDEEATTGYGVAHNLAAYGRSLNVVQYSDYGILTAFVTVSQALHLDLFQINT